MCFERWQVRREATARATQRRSAQAWRLGLLRLSASGPPNTLAATIESAVLAADVTWTYRRKLEATSVESPFELRRARAESAVRRYWAELERVRAAAHRWLERDGATSSEERRHAVERLAAFIDAGPPPDVAGQEFIDTSIDLLESTLASLVRVRAEPRVSFHPFRGGAAAHAALHAPAQRWRV